MSATDDPQAFFDEHAPALKAAATQGAPQAIAFIESFSDEVERRIMYLFARRALMMEEWPGRTLDVCVDVARAGIAEMLRQSEAAQAPEIRKRFTNLANAMSYDLAADTADCWPGDELARTAEHYRVGLAAAEDCIRWRTELNAGDDALALAWWAKGMHLLSLGETPDARDAFKRSFTLAGSAARASGRTDRVAIEGEFGVILGWGYYGLAEWVLGEPDGKMHYGEAISTFNAQCADPDLEEDARFGIDQLELVRSKYVGT
jgi:hypothetical protein